MGSAGGGSGDVAGPASVTDNEIARFNGTTGKLLQSSSVILDDSQRIFGASGGGVALDTAGTVKIASSSGAPTQNGALTSATFRVYAQGDTARETSLFVLSTAPYLGLYDSTAPNIRFSRSGNAENSHNAIISNSIAAVVDFDSSAVANGLGSGKIAADFPGVDSQFFATDENNVITNG